MSCSFSRTYHQPESPLWIRSNALSMDILESKKAEIEARRNPLSKDMERKKKMEFAASAKYKTTHKEDFAYAFGVVDAGKPVYVYVGVSDAPDRRWEEHKAGIADRDNRKAAYVAARELQATGATIEFWNLGPTGEFTERDFIEALLEQGHPLQQGITGNGKRRRKLLGEVKDALALSNKAKANVKKANAGLTPEQRLIELGYRFQGSELTPLEEELHNVLDDPETPEEVRKLVQEWIDGR